MPAIPILKSLLITASGSFNPATDGQGRSLFKFRYGGGGGGGNSLNGGGSGQIFETDWMSVPSTLTITIGAAGAGANDSDITTVGGDTTIVGTDFSLRAFGARASSANNTGGRTPVPGNSATTPLYITGGGSGSSGKPGIANVVAVAGEVCGGIVLSPGGASTLGSNGGGGGGYKGPGGNAFQAGQGYSSGGGTQAAGKAGFVEVIWT